MGKHKTIRANIVSWDGGGLGTDIDVLTLVLQQIGCEVNFKGRRHRIARNRFHSLLMTAFFVIKQQWTRISGRYQFDINFFIESVFPEYLPMARINSLFVNPEWFRDEIYNYLHHLDILLCKTSDCINNVSDLPVASKNVHFSSPDRHIDGYARGTDQIRCLHLSGQSALKGTESVIKAWSRHPEWPHLTVVRRAKRYGGDEAPPLQELPNVKYITNFVPEAQLKLMQNECEVHVIPSLAEGYGHVIGEAMSCAAVVVTTNASPMNELIRPDRGILIRVERSEVKFRSKLNYIDVTDLEDKLDMLFAMSQKERAELGCKARAWYQAQHVRFEKAIRTILNELL